MRSMSFVSNVQGEKSVLPCLFLIMFGYDKLYGNSSESVPSFF